MNEEQKVEFLKATKFAIVVLNKERTKIISCAFYETELTEEDFFDLRSRLMEQGLPQTVKLRMATIEELNKARDNYLLNAHNLKADFYENMANSQSLKH